MYAHTFQLVQALSLFIMEKHIEFFLVINRRDVTPDTPDA